MKAALGLGFRVCEHRSTYIFATDKLDAMLATATCAIQKNLLARTELWLQVGCHAKPYPAESSRPRLATCWF